MQKTIYDGSTPFADISVLEKIDIAEKSDLRKVYQVYKVDLMIPVPNILTSLTTSLDLTVTLSLQLCNN